MQSKAARPTTSLFIAPFLGPLVLPSVDLAHSVPIGIVALVLARWLPLPSLVIRLIAEHRFLATVVAGAACTGYWRESAEPFDKGLQAALVVYVVSSFLGASTRAPTDRNVGAMLGLLLAGAYGGFVRSFVGLFFGAGIGWMMKTRSGAVTGLVIGTLSSACLMAPGCASYELGFGPVIETAEEQRDDMASGTSSGLAEDSVFYRGPFQDRIAILPSAGLLSFTWLFGLPFGAIIGAILGELAKAGPLRRLLGAAAVPPASTSDALQPAPEDGPQGSRTSAGVQAVTTHDGARK